jgi:hypothetical protein
MGFREVWLSLVLVGCQTRKQRGGCFVFAFWLALDKLSHRLCLLEFFYNCKPINTQFAPSPFSAQTEPQMTLQEHPRIRMIHNRSTDKDKWLAQARIQASTAAKKWALQIHQPKRRMQLPAQTMPRSVLISRSSDGEVADKDTWLAEARIQSRLAAKTWAKSRQIHELS